MQFAGIPFAFLFGMLAGRIGAKASIFIGLAVYIADDRQRVLHEDRARLLRARADGRDGAGWHAGAQPIALREHDSARARSSEFFGFFSIFEKFGAIAGPAVFEVASRTTGSSRSAILSVMVFFIAGAAVLSFVNVKEGQAAITEGLH